MSAQIPSVPKKEFLKSQVHIISDVLSAFSSYQKKYGPFFRVNVGGSDIFVTTGADYAAHILVKNHRKYSKDRPTRIVADYIGNGILTSEPPYWLRQRRLIQPAFHKTQVENLSKIILAESRRFVAQIPTDKPTELHEQMVKLTLNVVSKALFSTAITEEIMEQTDHAVSSLMELATARIRNPLKVLAYRVSGRMKSFQKQIDDLDQTIYQIIDQRKQEGPRNQDLLDMLLTSKDAETEEYLSDKQLKEETLVLFLAGYDTSSNAMTAILHLLDAHPEVQEKARAEADQFVKNGSIAFEDLRKLTYTTQVIKESMRLYPPAWLIGREALEDDLVVDMPVKAGDGISIFIYGLHRNPEYWERPEEFDPDRFEPEKEKARPAYAYIPFGGGPRLCIGQQFAMTEMQMAIPLILNRYHFKRETSGPIKYNPAVTLRPAEPIMMRFWER